MELFHLCRFSIRQGRTAMKVGTDSICLGAWVAGMDIYPTNILDIGAGTGILSLMMAQAYPDAQITAVELDEGAVLDCQENFQTSPFASCCRLIHGDVLQYCQAEKFDLIISNPPYFSDSNTSTILNRSRARTEDCHGLNWSSLFTYARKQLRHEGELFLIAPASRLADLRAYAIENLFVLSELYFLSHSGEKSSRILTRWRRLKVSDNYTPTTIDRIIVKTSEGNYTERFKAMTKEFLLSEYLESVSI